MQRKSKENKNNRRTQNKPTQPKWLTDLLKGAEIQPVRSNIVPEFGREGVGSPCLTINSGIDTASYGGRFK